MEIIEFIIMLLCFLIMFVFFPYLCIRHLIKINNKFAVFFISLGVGTAFFIIIVYLLYLLNIFGWFSLLLCMTGFAVACQFFGDKVHIQTVKAIINQKYNLFTNGQFKLRTFLNNITHKKIEWKKPKNGYFIAYFTGIFMLIALGYGLYTKIYPSVGVDFFGVSDLYVHMDWLRNMQVGTIFYNGVYPFGMHNSIIAFNAIFPFKLATVLNFWGGIIYIQLLIGYIYLVFSMFKSNFARLGAIWFLCISGIFGYFFLADYRMSFALPQEAALIFALPAVMMMINYFRKGEKQYLYICAVLYMLTVLIHVYATVFLTLALLLVVALNIKKLFKSKMFLRTAALFLVAGIIGMLPLGLGLVMGIKFEKSIDWALNVANSAPVTYEYDEYGKKEPIANSRVSVNELGSVIERQIKEYLLPEPSDENGISRERINGYLLVFAVAGSFLLLAVSIIKKNKENFDVQLWFILFCALVFLIDTAYWLGLPQLIDSARLMSILRFLLPVLFGCAVEAVYLLVRDKKASLKAVFNWVLVAVVLVLGLDAFVLNNIQKPVVSVQAQYASTVDVIYRMQNEIPDKNLTFISTTYEYPLMNNEGYHHELIDFLDAQRTKSLAKGQYIPTKDVFIFAEKSPLPVYRIADPAGRVKLTPALKSSESYAALSIEDIDNIPDGRRSETYYDRVDNRAVIMSKTIKWAQEYAKYYPDEMSVYFEDDDIIVYRITQDMYALNNLAIDYGYND